jgi:hypothetical protein
MKAPYSAEYIKLAAVQINFMCGLGEEAVNSVRQVKA